MSFVYKEFGEYKVTHLSLCKKYLDDILKSIIDERHIPLKKAAIKGVYLSDFLVYEEYRGKGHGYDLLMECLLNQNLPANTDYVFLFVDRNNIKAVNMYMKAGGRICGMWDGTEGFGEDYLIYYQVEK